MKGVAAMNARGLVFLLAVGAALPANCARGAERQEREEKSWFLSRVWPFGEGQEKGRPHRSAAAKTAKKQAPVLGLPLWPQASAANKPRQPSIFSRIQQSTRRTWEKTRSLWSDSAKGASPRRPVERTASRPFWDPRGWFGDSHEQQTKRR